MTQLSPDLGLNHKIAVGVFGESQKCCGGFRGEHVLKLSSGGELRSGVGNDVPVPAFIDVAVRYVGENVKSLMLFNISTTKWLGFRVLFLSRIQNHREIERKREGERERERDLIPHRCRQKERVICILIGPVCDEKIGLNRSGTDRGSRRLVGLIGENGGAADAKNLRVKKAESSAKVPGFNPSGCS